MTMQAGTMKQIIIFIAGIVTGAVAAVVGFFVAEYVGVPGGGRR
jgi:hypothetical protein